MLWLWTSLWGGRPRLVWAEAGFIMDDSLSTWRGGLSLQSWRLFLVTFLCSWQKSNSGYGVKPRMTLCLKTLALKLIFCIQEILAKSFIRSSQWKHNKYLNNFFLLTYQGDPDLSKSFILLVDSSIDFFNWRIWVQRRSANVRERILFFPAPINPLKLFLQFGWCTCF